MNEQVSNKRQANQIVALSVFVLICFGCAALGAWVTTPRIPDWYAGLVKPSWTPPSWVFGPVWTLLYLMMAVAAWLVWREGNDSRIKVSLAVFAFQLALNSLWSIIFFGLKQPGYAACEIVILWLAIIATIVQFARCKIPAALLLVPYVVWVSFAMALNIAIWKLNS